MLLGVCPLTPAALAVPPALQAAEDKPVEAGMGELDGDGGEHDDTRHARCAVVTTGAGIAAELHLVGYDWERAAHVAEANGRPDWAYALRTGQALPEA